MRDRLRRAGRFVFAVAFVLVAVGVRAPVFGSQSPLDALQGGPTDFVPVRDGTPIAVTVCYPRHYVAGRTYPALLEMAGYENGSQGIKPNAFGPGTQTCSGRTGLGQLHDWASAATKANLPSFPISGDSHAGAMGIHYDADYFVVHASVRGTGCSGGEFDLFSQQSALDGYDLIENYIVKQPWSNQKVGIIGHSYSGITGTLVAEQQPPHLVAAAVSGLIDDVYRGITYPGGIFNGLFPPEWNLVSRPGYDVLGGSVQGVVRNLRDRPALASQCAINTVTHGHNVPDDPLLHGLSLTDTQWFQSKSLITYVNRINVPFMITGTFQDEQTGPRFAHFWERIGGVPKRLLMTNGSHGTNVDPPLMWQDRVAWLDYFMRGLPDSFVDPAKDPVSVRTLFELKDDNTTNEIKDSTSFPLNDTRWTPLFLHDANTSTGTGTLSLRRPASPGSAIYLAGTKRQSWSYEVAGDTGVNAAPPLTTTHAPDELQFRYPITSTMVIDGPITANLFVSTTSVDTDLFVQLIDEYQGKVSILQRGLLRASHAPGIQYDPAHSDYFGTDPVTGGPFLYRPWRTHTNPQLVTPGAIREYLVEVFPVAHIFRPGHNLVIKVAAPPLVDSQYAYVPGGPPVSLNTLFFSPTMPSRITMPVVAPPPVVNPTGPACGDYHSVRCLPE